MDTIFFKKTIVKKLFHFFCTVTLLLSGITAFAQGAPAYKAVVKGDFELIGNRSNAPYTLNIPQTDPNCPVNIKWARLYWGGHSGGGNKDQVRLVGPGGLNKSITKDGGHEETNGVVWADADYLIYRVYFTHADGDDMDMLANIVTPNIGLRAGYCGNNMPQRNVPNHDIGNHYALWSGANTGNGLESVLINVRRMEAVPFALGIWPSKQKPTKEI